ncbi:hypothetical protein GO730_29885 [Spirosoma sp. HMF3257]|uniref:Carboxypeptidase-like regulatory domain-containing protein n=1 Tax=Spirosoma telluris TaxID=2183553 RepID=A0A327NPY9_9BACT|nr:hypothetical protein [Spirosoma telluris]RAI77322.1 hypothetical protein HMF3257_29795 [Spirosoma telluris]
MKLYFSTIIAILLILIIPFELFSQSILIGTVEDGETHKPIPFANVFLSNTTKGAISDEQGKFTIKNVPIGRFDLIASAIGFETLKITLQTSDKRSYRIILKPSNNQLNDITVKARKDKSWIDKVTFFKNNFIGISENAKYCNLVNPEVLYFNDTLNSFRAYARDLLIVENRGLGYRLKYALIKFDYDYKKKKISYEGYPVFESITPESEKESNRWIENRKKAYLGSIRHFMKSLYKRQLFKNGFIVQRVIEKIDKSGKVRQITLHGKKVNFYPTPADTIVRVLLPDTLSADKLIDTDQSTNGQTVVSFQGTMQVVYFYELESFDYQQTHSPPKEGYLKSPQLSIMRMTSPSVVIEPDGHFYDPLGILFEWYWSWELVSEMLPFDYEII